MKQFYTLLLTLILNFSLISQNNVMKNQTDELIKTDIEFCKVSKEKGLEGWMSFFADDAIIFPNGLPVIAGKEAIKEYYSKVNFDPSIITWRPEYAEISESGEMGFTYGYADFEIKDSTGTKIFKGKYTTIWKKQSNGEWKVKLDFGNAAEK